MSPSEMAERLGLTTGEVARFLRDSAADTLEGLAADVRRGDEAARGDVDRDEFDHLVGRASELLRTAQAFDAAGPPS